MRREIALGEDSGYFEGHFPGRPILPGVAQLALMLEAAGGRPLAALRYARFRRLVAPGETLTIEVREGEDVHVVARAGGAVAAEATLALGEPAPADDWLTAIAARRPGGVPPIESLLPHRAPMLFVDGVAGEADDGLTCAARIPAACALVREGRAPAVVAIEAAAQTAAVWEALRRSRGAGGAPQVGYLVSARDVALHVRDVPAGEPLLASVRLTGRTGPLALYAVDVSLETHPLLRGTIGCWI